MKRKRVELDAFERYHRNAMWQEIFGMVFAVVGAIIIVGLLFAGMQLLAKH